MCNIQLHCFEGGLFGHNLLDVWLETGVCLQQLLAQAALHGGLDLGAIARWDTVGGVLLAYMSFQMVAWARKMHGILFLEHDAGC